MYKKKKIRIERKIKGEGKKGKKRITINDRERRKDQFKSINEEDNEKGRGNIKSNESEGKK